MPLDPSTTTNVLSATISRDKSQVFREHPRSVSFRFDGKWYQGIRVSAFSQDEEMALHAFNPETDTALKINLANFTDETGATPIAPAVNDRIRMDNTDWRVEERIVEADDYRLILRKEVAAA